MWSAARKMLQTRWGPERMSHGLSWKWLAATEAETNNSSETASEENPANALFKARLLLPMLGA